MKTLRQLDRENKKNLRLLPDEMQKELKTMFGFLRHSRINSYDGALIFSDLIAMALEAHERGEGLDDVLGETQDKEAFCKQLAETARPKSLMESALFWLRILLLWVFVGFGLELVTYSRTHLVGEGFFHLIGVTPRHLTLVAGMCFLDCAGRYYYRFAYKGDRFQVLYAAGAFLAYFVAGTVMVRLLPWDTALFFVAYEPGMLAALVAWLASELLYLLCVRPGKATK